MGQIKYLIIAITLTEFINIQPYGTLCPSIFYICSNQRRERMNINALTLGNKTTHTHIVSEAHQCQSSVHLVVSVESSPVPPCAHSS